MRQKISVDLETLGNGPQAMIVAIGAVKFDAFGGAGETFYRVVDLDAPGGGVMDISTVLWWFRQSEEARRVFTDPELERLPLMNTLVEFSEFLGFTDELEEGKYPDIELWQRGDADHRWLTSAYQGVGLKEPYGFWQWKDQRTFCDRFKDRLPPRTGVAHNALDDAIYQAQCIVAVESWLRSVGAVNDRKPIPVVSSEETLLKVRTQCLEMGYSCGLATVGEAMDNVVTHALNLWPYDEIAVRQAELYRAFVGIDPSTEVAELLGPDRCAALDKEMDFVLDERVVTQDSVDLLSPLGTIPYRMGDVPTVTPTEGFVTPSSDVSGVAEE